MKRDDFKNYAASLRDKSTKFKKLKAEFNDMRHEVAVLTRSEQILQAKDPTPAGMRETEAMIEKASIDKSQIDKNKGKTLDEISNIVTKINTQLKDKKNKLAPQIKALRSVRQNFQQVENRYMEKKAAYDQAKSSMDGELIKISGEAGQLESEVLEAEQAYHELNMQLCAAESRLQIAHRETRCMRKEERFSHEFATLSDSHTSEINRLDETCRELRKQQKFVKDGHESNLRQKKAFSCLQKLMQVKLKVARQETQAIADGRPTTMMYGTRSMMDASTAGVERLVLEP
jgi:intraflagellar transport protein 81